MKRIGIVYLLIFLFPIISFGQIISGKIIDRISAEPIPYANILIKDSYSGTVSNEDGEFEISVVKSTNEFTLVISVIGYKTAQIELSKDTHYPSLIIELEEKVFELDEVVISYLSPNQIFDNFHKNYSVNYYQKSALLKAFYHSAFSENDEFKHLLEATINVREFRKKKHRTFEVEITQRRKSNDYRIERWGEKNNYLYDAIASNPMLELSDFLDKKNQKYYDLERLPNTTYNSESVYVVRFTPKKNTNKPLYEATAYFNSDDFALIKAEYAFDNDEHKIQNQSLKDKTYHIPFVSGSVQYQKIDEYYILKYLGYNNGWTVINNISNDTIVKDILKDEILFHETQYDNSEPLANPLTKWGDIYNKPFGYDADYWNNQVKIPPSQLFKTAIEDLEKRQPIEMQYFNNSANTIDFQNFGNSPGGRIDSVLTVYNLTMLFNGVALVTSNGKIIHHKAYGYQDIQDSILLDTSAVFDI
ncbi:carboxypeptidase-like regulatory domain-containing protein, partial [Nonlabens ulvanivorans]|uniref:carboxypeptidase-like regulatory domain-containing protein n=1 Tax=Nonlabens ulvanivorans TaxID=906888 RepID=UPI003299A70D